MKKIVSLIITLAIAVTALASCGIIDRVESAVVYPDTYSITYEITTVEGLIHTVTKTVDSNGNIYFKSIEDEKLFIKDNDSYTLYEKNADNKFAKTDGARYTKEAVEKELELFDSYVKRTTDKFIPTARRTGETSVVGRTADTYKIGVNLLAVSFHHIYYVDQATGICLGADVVNKTFGNETKDNEETFICVAFDTEMVEDLSSYIQ
ncbi:MAG: hypothetical protein IJW53_06350 [Clostridia bacterium]|nr:hypothetical protein [Clostridia bacterium]